jgi:hypothetical protein
MERPRLHRISNTTQAIWSVSYAGMEVHFTKEWKAVDLYNMLLNQPTNPESLIRVIHSMSSEL